jgi:hypothetical protein
MNGGTKSGVKYIQPQRLKWSVGFPPAPPVEEEDEEEEK